jgi:hypothetical protein
MGGSSKYGRYCAAPGIGGYHPSAAAPATSSSAPIVTGIDITARRSRCIMQQEWCVVGGGAADCAQERSRASVRGPEVRLKLDQFVGLMRAFVASERARKFITYSSRALMRHDFKMLGCT